MTPVTCHLCEYEWDYGGSQDRATCPDCGSKTDVDGNMTAMFVRCADCDMDQAAVSLSAAHRLALDHHKESGHTSRIAFED